MPLSVEIKLNGREIRTIWIGRMEEFKGEDEEHEYMCGFGRQNLEPWNFPGIKVNDLPRFTHKYSDGAEICVRKALERLEMADDLDG